MPVVGSFHTKYWRARANTPPPPGTATGWMYPQTQSAVIVSMAIWGFSFGTLRPIWDQIRWLWALCRQLWWYRSSRQRQQVAMALALVSSPERGAAVERLAGLLQAPEHEAILNRVIAMVQSSRWEEACNRVRACMTTPKFHQPEQWVAYSRAVKASAGQAQNIWRHVRVVQELQATQPLSNSDAHLLAELAYQAVAATDARPRQIIAHPVLSRPA